jgi:hypothetical protein
MLAGKKDRQNAADNVHADSLDNAPLLPDFPVS